nr:MAG TPA: hypothetical protein [Caudoviricetes sp.]
MECNHRDFPYDPHGFTAFSMLVSILGRSFSMAGRINGFFGIFPVNVHPRTKPSPIFSAFLRMGAVTRSRVPNSMRCACGAVARTLPEQVLSSNSCTIPFRRFPVARMGAARTAAAWTAATPSRVALRIFFCVSSSYFCTSTIARNASSLIFAKILIDLATRVNSFRCQYEFPRRAVIDMENIEFLVAAPDFPPLFNGTRSDPYALCDLSRDSASYRIRLCETRAQEFRPSHALGRIPFHSAEPYILPI